MLSNHVRYLTLLWDFYLYTSVVGMFIYIEIYIYIYVFGVISNIIYTFLWHKTVLYVEQHLENTTHHDGKLLISLDFSFYHVSSIWNCKNSPFFLAAKLWSFPGDLAVDAPDYYPTPWYLKHQIVLEVLTLLMAANKELFVAWIPVTRLRKHTILYKNRLSYSFKWRSPVQYIWPVFTVCVRC